MILNVWSLVVGNLLLVHLTEFKGVLRHVICVSWITGIILSNFVDPLN